MRALAEQGGRSGWAPSPAGPLRYTIRGPAHAPQLLLLHGLGDSLAGWARVVPALARVYEVHLLDLPGHGLSARPPGYRLETLEAAVAAYAARLQAPLLVGHSLGGWLAVRLARTLRPRTLTLINPGGAPLGGAAWLAFRELVSARDDAAVRRYLDQAFRKAPLLFKLFPGEVRKAMWAEAAQGVLDAITGDDVLSEQALRELQTPVHLVWGEHDRMLPCGSFEFFRRALPRARLTLLSCGHLPHLEAPRELSQALLR